MRKYKEEGEQHMTATPENPQEPEAVIYARAATEHLAEMFGRFAPRHITSRVTGDSLRVRRIYCDVRSTTQTDRPALQSLLRDLKRRPADCVLVIETGRPGQSRRLRADIEDELMATGARIHADVEDWDMSRGDGRRF
jgi:DNA invertase Pin-like site-specific DNA recombinase